MSSHPVMPAATATFIDEQDAWFAARPSLEFRLVEVPASLATDLLRRGRIVYDLDSRGRPGKWYNFGKKPIWAYVRRARDGQLPALVTCGKVRPGAPDPKAHSLDPELAHDRGGRVIWAIATRAANMDLTLRQALGALLREAGHMGAP